MGLRLDFLGPFKLDGRSVSSQTLGRKAIGALAALALAPDGTMSRSSLAGLLWSDRGEEQARDSLRQVLSSIRRAFASYDPLPISADRDRVTLNLKICATDTEAFLQGAQDDSREGKIEAADLYKGPLLDGLAINDSLFQDWQERERSRFEKLAVSTLEWLLSEPDAEKSSDLYSGWADSLLAIDELSEAAARARMQHHASVGESAKIALEYERLKTALRGALNVAPAMETVRVFEELTGVRTESQDPIGPEGPSEPKPVSVPHLEITRPTPSGRHPRIAVLPLRNLSGNPDESYFVDGVTEDIIVSLSSFRALRVISSQSSFGFRTTLQDPTSVASELRAAYLVSGSLRRSTERVRINVELIAGETGENVWASRFDRELKDIFEIQEQISKSIVTCVVGQIERTAFANQRRKATDDLSAYELVLRANEKLHQVRWHDNIQARDFYQAALGLDEEFARAHVGMALAFFDAVFMGWGNDSLLPDGVEHASRAAALDPIDSHAQLALGMLKFLQRDFSSAEFHLEAAHRLNESDADIMIYFAIFMIYNGAPDRALSWIDQAVALNPLHPEFYFTVKGTAHFGAGQFDKALEAYSHRSNHDRLVLAYMTAAASMADRPDDHEKYLRELRANGTSKPVDGKKVADLLTDEIGLYRLSEDKDKLAATFRKIGLLPGMQAH